MRSDTETDSETESECAICLDTLTPQTFYRLSCRHRLHKTCFLQYVQYNYDIENNSLLCPICKQPLEVNLVSTDMIEYRSNHFLSACRVFVYTLLLSVVSFVVVLTVCL